MATQKKIISTAIQVKNATKPGLHSIENQRSLYLKISPTGSKSWVARYRKDGRLKSMGIGRYPDVSLKEASDTASELRLALKDGRDPLAEKRAAREKRKTMQTFRECATTYISENTFSETNQGGWKNDKHVQQWQNTLRDYVYPIVGDMPVDQITIAEVSRCLKPIWATKHETATRVRQRIEAVLDLAMAEGLIQNNVAKYEGALRRRFKSRNKLKVEIKHHPALDYHEMPVFWTELDSEEGLAAEALKLTILCTTRTSETLKAEWTEFDLEAGIWIIPAERMKANKEHRIPLSAESIKLIKKLPRLSERFLFPSPRDFNKPMSQMSMAMVLRRMKREDITVHGMRSTFRDFIGEETGHPFRLVEVCLAHQLTDKAEKAYARGDMLERRRRLMQDWASYCFSETAQSNVTPLRSAS